MTDPLLSYLDDKLPKGASILLLTHQAAVLKSGINRFEQLHKSGYRLLALLTPEHGFYATAQDHESVLSTSINGVQSYSLYGQSVDTLSPPENLVEEADLIIVDLVDIGTRYYTYAATALYTLRSAAAAQ